MKSIELNGSLRTETGKKFAKKLRSEELVPAILYGGEAPVMFSVVVKDLKPIIYTPNVYVIKLNLNGKVFEAILKDIQFHPVSDAIIHVDFQQIFADKKVTVALPIVLTGVAEGARQGGKLMLITRKLRANGFVKDMPDTLDVDVTELGLGKTRLVGELKFDNINIVDPKSTVVATVKLTRAARGAQAAEGK
ncbi:MAG: 50S ribosomal protein L25/general stress protein Ctc [Bacteroidales bacterium]|nr:50S ribosomal protein L25/general stress protein Ctc [Bacteroidales bacterium]MBN2750493.1 50S ribosomal protein L25/general stress protein Ctc [Bacteroidales bacterium]